jgi:two-component system, NtrC family, sensor kinase
MQHFLTNIHSLRTKFVLLFLTFFFIPFGLLTFLSVSMNKGMMKQSTISHLENLVEVKETAIEQWLKERVVDAKTISESEEIKSLDPRRIDPYLALLKQFSPAYRELWVVDLKGRRLSQDASGSSYEKEDWFQEAFQDRFFISVIAPVEPSFLPTVTISVLIKNKAGDPIGVFKELVDMTFVSELVSEARLGETGMLYLVDLRGRFVLHKGLKELSRRRITEVTEVKKSPNRPLRTEVYRNYRNSEVLGAWKWVSGLQCYLVAEQDVNEAFYQTNNLVKKASFIFIVSALLILGLSYWAIGTVTNPIKALSETVTLFSEGQFKKAVVRGKKDEIGKLIEGFNTMAERLKKAYGELEGRVKASNSELEVAYEVLKQRQEQLIRSEKMAALGQLSAGIAHEIRTPLTSIKIFIQSLEKEIDLDKNQKEDFRIIKKEIDRINENVTRFLNFARPEEPVFQQVNIHGLVRETLNLLAPKLKNSGIGLDLSLQENPPPVEGDPKQLGQVFLNLLLNAIEAMPQGGVLTVGSSVKRISETQEELLQLVIKDTGCGILEKDKPYLFDPFFTTKEGGTGLGLSIVYSIVQKHNGQVEVESEPGKGSSFIVSLPTRKEGQWKELSSSMTT